MKKNYIIGAFILLVLASCDQPNNNSQLTSADKVFFASTIYTVNNAVPVASAVAVKDGRIVFVGSKVASQIYIGKGTEVVDLGGATMFPGFTDGHAHLLGIGNREVVLNLEGVLSIADLRQKISAALDGLAKDELLYGRGWIETHWPEIRFLTKHDLDDISPNNPVVLTRADGHALVANSLALGLVGINKDSVSVEGGKIHHDENGEPNGLLIDNAQFEILNLVSKNIESDKSNYFIKAGEVYSSYGWTGIHNMSVDPNDVGDIERLSDKGQLGIRVYNSIDMVSKEGGVNDLAINRMFNDGPRRSRNGNVVTRSIKVYLDGALGSRGAALLEPYSDDPENIGLIRSDKEHVLPVLKMALRTGIQINAHAIGDRGNRTLMNWFEEAFNAVPKSQRTIGDPRWRDEHSQIVHPDDIKRFVSLGIIPSMQASHAIGDMFFAPSRLGDARLDGAYAWQTILNSGSIIVGGSDAPVERGDPRIEFYAAVSRMWLDGTYGDNWRMEEAVSREDALKMFTLWPAYASFQEDDLGSIEVGKLADFTVFSDDIMKVPLQDILKTKAIMTVVGGDVIYNLAPTSN
jgi:hypothetical protein